MRSLRALGTSWALWNWAFSAPVFPVSSPPSKSGGSLPTAPWLPVIMPCQKELAAQEILLLGPNPRCHLQKCPRAAFLLSTERRWNPRVHLETPARDIARDVTPLGTFAPCSQSCCDGIYYDNLSSARILPLAPGLCPFGLSLGSARLQHFLVRPQEKSNQKSMLESRNI